MIPVKQDKTKFMISLYLDQKLTVIDRQQQKIEFKPQFKILITEQLISLISQQAELSLDSDESQADKVLTSDKLMDACEGFIAHEIE